MSEDFVMSMGSEALKTIILISAPMLAAAMVIGIIVSILQAITQINEATLTFIPKMAAIIIVMLVMAPWMLETMQTYARDIFGNFGSWVR